MATARRKALRVHAVQQAALVWLGKEIDIREFIDRSDMSERPSVTRSMHPELRAEMEKYIDEYKRTGILVVGALKNGSGN